ncbi:MAG: flagellar export chaperone FlgN [Pseudomonadota bacterium]
MNNLERAIETTEMIRDALAAEIVVAREERVLIRGMDIDGLFLRAAKRAEFNQTTATLQQELAQSLGETARAFGLTQVTLEGLKGRAPEAGQRMANVLAEVRALAAALAELDSLNRMLGQRALSYVRAHLAVLSPKPSAYDRRGGSAADTRASTVVRVA